MARLVRIRNHTRGDRMIATALWCQSVLCRMKGLMFRRSLPQGRALLLVQEGRDRLSSGIHMFLVFFSIGVIWIDKEGMVVDSVLARPWRVYMPGEAAHYVLEGDPAILDSVSIGDALLIEEELS